MNSLRFKVEESYFEHDPSCRSANQTKNIYFRGRYEATDKNLLEVVDE